jgi:hypothetical protein
VTRAFFATRHAYTKEMNAFRQQLAGAHVGIFEVGVAGIDDKVAGCVAKFFEIRDNARFLAIEKPND